MKIYQCGLAFCTHWWRGSFQASRQQVHVAKRAGLLTLSTVNQIVASVVLMWQWKSSLRLALRPQQLPFMYRFQSSGDLGTWALASISFITRSAATTETGDPMAVPCICC